MTDLTLEEFRCKAPDQELAARLRKDAFLIWGSYTNPAELEIKSKARRKSRLSTLAAWFLRLSFRTSP